MLNNNGRDRVGWDDTRRVGVGQEQSRKWSLHVHVSSLRRGVDKAMAIAKCVSSLLKILLSLTILNGVSASDVKVIATKNFTDVLEGEWMLEL